MIIAYCLKVTIVHTRVQVYNCVTPSVFFCIAMIIAVFKKRTVAVIYDLEDAGEEHSLREKNHMFICSSIHFICSAIPDLTLKVLKKPIHLCVLDVLKSTVLQLTVVRNLI